LREWEEEGEVTPPKLRLITEFLALIKRNEKPIPIHLSKYSSLKQESMANRRGGRIPRRDHPAEKTKRKGRSSSTSPRSRRGKFPIDQTGRVRISDKKQTPA